MAYDPDIHRTSLKNTGFNSFIQWHWFGDIWNKMLPWLLRFCSKLRNEWLFKANNSFHLVIQSSWYSEGRTRWHSMSNPLYSATDFAILKYTYSELTSRVRDAELPLVHIITVKSLIILSLKNNSDMKPERIFLSICSYHRAETQQTYFRLIWFIPHF